MSRPTAFDHQLADDLKRIVQELQQKHTAVPRPLHALHADVVMRLENAMRQLELAAAELVSEE
jgi:hypothetical protein